jgi:mannobiose 2-epimerase
LRDENLLKLARMQFEFMQKHMLDPKDGGIYWETERSGKIRDARKHAYAQAFALYSLSAYYTAGKDEAALIAADRLFNLIENKFKDGYGYPEPFIIDIHEFEYKYTTNTLLHIIEAYTEYYQASGSEKARNALAFSLNLVINKAYNESLGRIECYFDEFMNPAGNMHSYGVISKGFVDEGRGGIYYDNKNGVDNKLFEWWVPSEAIVALVHRYNLYGDEKSMILAENVWEYVKKYFISQYGEWHWRINESDKQPVKNSILCGPWKCPYHNGRLCLEMMSMPD